LGEAGDEQEFIEKAILALDSEKKEGEKSSDYEKRMSEDARKLFNL
jgi:hypothetical protein